MSKTTPTEWFIDQIERGRTERWVLETANKRHLEEIGRLQREVDFLELQLQKACDMADTTREDVEFAATFDIEVRGQKDKRDEEFMGEMQGLLDHALDQPQDPNAAVKVDIIMDEDGAK